MTLTTFAALLLAATATAATFTVNNNGNTSDVNPGDGLCRDANNRCTVRAAIMEANALAGADTINLQSGATYTISTADTADPANAFPLITTQIVITGNGATIRRDPASGTPIFRIFRVFAPGNLTLRNLTLTGGSGPSGGALYVGAGSTATLSGVTLQGNQATANTGGGGAIINDSGTLTIENSTISGNTSLASNGGGGILVNGSTTTTTIVSSTIAENRADGPVGARGRGDNLAGISPGVTTIRNSIIASPLSGIGDDCYAISATSLGNNFVSDISCALLTPGDLNGNDPLLGPLANNGGSTQTHALTAGSPAINAVAVGSCRNAAGAALATDQRGTARPQGAACDSGAFEATNLTFTPTTLTWSPTPAVTSTLGAAITLRVQVGGYTNGATSTVVFYDGGNIIGYANVANTGLATVNPILTSSGAHNFRAYYLGRTTGTPLSPSASPVAVTQVTSTAGATLAKESPITDTPARSLLALDNMNGNNRTDVVYGGTQPGFTVLTAGGNMSFTKQTPVTNIVWQSAGVWKEMTSAPTGLATGDFDRDGVKDVVITSDNHIAVVRGNGGGAFPNGVPGSTSNTWFAYSFPVGTVVADPVVADFDRDGDSDIAVITNQSEIRVFYGNGAVTRFTYLPSPASPTFGIGSKLLTADLNKDGYPDLLWMVTGNGLGMILGDANGITLYTWSTISLSGAPTGVTLADFNGDGNLDIAATSGNTIYIALATAPGVYPASATAITANSGILALNSGDFDGDGKQDLIVTRNGTVEVWKGDGAGGFTLNWNLDITGTNGVALDTADFSGDGREDVVMANALGGLSFFRNTVPSQLVRISGSPQTTAAGTPFGQPLIVEARNNQGVALQGIPIQFNPPTTGASATVTAPTKTAINGRLSANATANGTVGAYNVGAAVIAPGNGSTNFNLTNTAALPANIAIVSGNNQTVDVNLNFGADLMVRVTDSFGNPVIGATVNFAAPTGPVASAILNVASDTTDNQGRARVSPKANTLVGTYQVTATIGTLSVSFTLTNTSANNGTKSIFAGNNQTTGNGQPFPLAFKVLVKDNFNNPMVGKQVTFSAPNAAGSFPGNLQTVNVNTDNAGIATSPILTAGTNLNTFTVTATATATGPNLSFTIRVINATTTALIATPASANFGQQVTLTATVAPATATGLVTFYEGPAILGFGTLTGGVATLKTTTLSAGAHTLRTVYGGATNFMPSTSATATVTVTAQPGASFVLKHTANTGAWPSNLAIGDVNGDGRNDLITSNENSGTLSVFLGNGDGTFGAATDYPVGWAYAIVIADINRDGKPDLVVPQFSPSRLSLLLGNGNGTFQPSVDTNGGSSLARIAVGDLDGDGFPDVISSDPNGAGLLLFRGQGTSFQAPTTITSLAHTTDVVLADFNNDGKLDYAAVSASPDVAVGFGNGDGTFQTPQILTLTGFSLGITAADFNNDGKIDLAVADRQGNKVVSLINNGNGTFQPTGSYPLGGSPTNISSGDFDGDGKTDLAVTNQTLGRFSILKGNGDATFLPPVDFPVTNSERLAVGEFNGDGRADIAIAVAATNQTLVYLGAVPTAITTVTGTPQSATTGAAFGTTLKTKVTTTGSIPLQNVLVTMAPPPTGASATISPTSKLTDANGEATFTAQANSTAGTYAVAAGIPNFTPTATFNLTNTAVVTYPVTIDAVRTFTLAPFTGSIAVTGVGCDPGIYSTPKTFNWPAGLTCTVELRSIIGSQTRYVPGPSAAAWTDSNTTNPRIITTGNAAATYTGNYHAQSNFCIQPSPAGGGTFTIAGYIDFTNYTGCALVWESYPARPSESLTPNPAAGYLFLNWSGDATGTAVPLTVVHNAPRTITGNFVAIGSFTVSGGSPQSTAVSTAFAQPLQVRLLDTNGNGIPGVTVGFTATGVTANATLSSPTAVTNASGIAQVTATANATIGSYSVVANVGTLSATFNLTNNPATATLAVQANYGDAAFTVTVNGTTSAHIGGTQRTVNSNDDVTLSHPPNPQEPTQNVRYYFQSWTGYSTDPLTLTKPISSATINAVLTPSYKMSVTGSATLSPSSADGYYPSNGSVFTPVTVTGTCPAGLPVLGLSIASFEYYNGQSLVPATVASTVPNGSVITMDRPRTLTVLCPTLSSITVSSGNNQQTAINTQFAQPLSALVLDSNNNPIGGVTVTFAPGAGASATLSSLTAVTNSSGIASVTATANSIAGSYGIPANAPGLLTPAVFNLTNLPPAPASIAVAAGSPQQTPISTAFAQPLAAVVRDANNNPLNGITVTFTVTPAGNGAAATVSSTTATTGPNGIATVNATANATSGSYIVTATAAGLIGQSATFNLTNLAPVPAQISVVSGSGQTTAINTPFGTPLRVRVVDANGNPISGLAVIFNGPPVGASASMFPGPTTNSNGETQVNAVANGTPGTYQVSATVAGYPPVFTNFQLTNIAPPASIAVVSGSGQSTIPGSPFSQPLVVVVKDAFNNPVPNITVAFAPPFSGASANISPAFVQTGPNGQAMAGAFANLTPGTYQVGAFVQAIPSITTSFTLTNGTPLIPASISVNAGNNQTTTINTAFPLQLEAVVRTSFGQPVPGVVVTFAPPPSGASATLNSTTATTDNFGIARVSATANSTAGAYQVTANYPSGPGTSFSLTNVGIPASVTVGAGSSFQFATVNTAFLQQLKAIVRDTNSNPVPGVTVTFAPPPSGASAGLSSTTAVTDSTGTAAVTAIANAITGGYAVTATTNSLPAASFTLINSPNTVLYTVRTVGGIAAAGYGINASGQTTGQIGVVGQQHAFFDNGLTFTDVHTLPGTYSTGNGINDSGQITGMGYIDANGTQRAFRYSGGVMTNLGTLGGILSSVGRAINNNGHVTGRASNGTNNDHAFFWNGSAMTDLGTLGGIDSEGLAINNAGHIAGGARDSANVYRPFFWNGTAMTPVTTPGTGAGVAYGINSADQIVGEFSTSSGDSRAFLWNGSAATDLGTLGGNSRAQAINTNGTIVGLGYTAGNTSQRAFVYSGGTMKDLNGLIDANSGWVLLWATGINDAGQIVGSGLLNGQSRVFVLNPAPASISVSGGNNQQTAINTAFAQPLSVIVRDANSNPLPNVTVTFAVPSSGTSAVLSSTTAVTNAAGIAQVTATANGIVGTYPVTATAAGLVGQSAGFTLTNTSGGGGAGSVSFNTNASVLSCGTAAGCSGGGSSITFTSGVETLVITYTPKSESNLSISGPGASTNYGELTTVCNSCSSGTFNLTGAKVQLRITQISPSLATQDVFGEGVFSGTLTASFGNSTSGLGLVLFPITTVTLPSSPTVTYNFPQPTLGPFNGFVVTAGNNTTFQGTVTQ